MHVLRNRNRRSTFVTDSIIDDRLLYCSMMVSAWVSRLMLLTAGTLYPAYRSYKAVKTKNVREYVKWMMYWIVLALFLTVETFADVFVSFWMPFYYELKIIFLVWLLSPYTKGASLVYRKFIHPALEKHEDDIDLYLEGAKNRGYSTLVRFGSRGVAYAKEIMAAAAVKGQYQLLNQITKSYSLNDVADAADAPVADRARSQSVSNKVGGAEAADAIDREFAYLDDDLDDQPLSLRIKKNAASTSLKSAAGKRGASRDDGDVAVKPRARRAKAGEVDAYATLPRRSTRVAASTKGKEPKES